MKSSRIFSGLMVKVLSTLLGLSLCAAPAVAQNDATARGLAVQARTTATIIPSKLPLERLITTKAGVLGGFSNNPYSNGTSDVSATSRMQVTVPFAVAGGVRVKFTNYYVVAGGQRQSTNSITVKADFELGVTYYPLYFNGSRTVTIAPGGEVWSDPLSVDLTAGQQPDIRTYVSVTSGGIWPQGRYGGLPGEGTNRVAGGADVSDGSGALASMASDYMYGPTMIVGDTYGKIPTSVCLIGDSIAAGAAAGGTPDSYNDYGLYEFALATKFPWTSITRLGWTLSNFVQQHDKILNDTNKYCTHVLLELGFNDLNGNANTAAQMEANEIAAVNLLHARGLIVHATTITPYSIGGTPNSPSATANTNTYNDWLRANYQSIGIQYLHDVSDAASTARDSGIWNPSMQPADGIHPQGTATLNTLSAAVNTSKFVQQ